MYPFDVKYENNKHISNIQSSVGNSEYRNNQEAKPTLREEDNKYVGNIL